MDSKVKKCCRNCSQIFCLKTSANKQRGRIPLLLPCGHPVCEVCIRNIVKFTEPIDCQICNKAVELSPSQQLMCQTNLYSVFPVNIYMLGELTLQQMESFESTALTDKDCFIDLKHMFKTLDNPTDICAECRVITTTMCKKCGYAICKSCMQKTHTFQMFKHHTLTEIQIDFLEGSVYCKTHKEKTLDYYCKDCTKMVCMDCMIVGGEKSCKTHDVVSAQEINETAYEQLNDIMPTVDETFRRLTKTSVDIGHLLKNLDNNAGKSALNKIRLDVQHHFSKLHAAIQKHEQEVIDTMENLKKTEKDSLIKAKQDVAEAIKKSKVLLNKMLSLSKVEDKPNVSALLGGAQEIINTPWCLLRAEEDDNIIKAAVNEDLCSLISDYVHLEGNANPAYMLCSTKQLGENVIIPPAPSAPVFPPELLKDVRELYKPRQAPESLADNRSNRMNLQQVPRYRSKYGSNSSINSLESDNSYKHSIHGGGEGSHNMPIGYIAPFKELVEGSQEVIFISHIVGPHNFYVQRACHQKLVKELHREYSNSVSLPRPSHKHLEEGKMYLVYNKAHREWQRCRLLSIDQRDPEKPLYHMLCVDFGNTEIVTNDELRLLPFGRLSTPPLAINCALANCKPKGESWTTADSMLIQKIIDNKRAVIHVRRVVPYPSWDTLECDVTTFEDGVSIAHALVYHERAMMINPRLKYPKVQVERPKLFLSSGDFEPRSKEEVHITHIVSPDKFYVRKTHLRPTYEKLCDDLNSEYSTSVTAGTVYYPEVDMLCVAYIENVEDGPDGGGGGWRRALVQDAGRGRARVLLPDCGRVLQLHYTALRHVQKRFTVQRALASECHLSGITPTNKRWSAASVQLLQRLVPQPVELRVEETGRGGSVPVCLYYTVDGDVVCLNSEMCRLKYAVAIGIFMFNKNMTEDVQVQTNKTPLDKPKPLPKKEKLKILKRGDPQPAKKASEEGLEAKDKGPIKLEVKILSCQSPSLVYVALIDQQKVFNDLYDHMQEYYTKKTVPGKEHWNVGDRCCTVCDKTKTWRRAVVLEKYDDIATVFYTDFAATEKVPLAGLKELAPEFTKIGDAAIKCHLSGVMPADGGQWPSVTNEYLSELVDAYQRIFITKNGAIKDRSLPVELWVYHVIQGDALEPNKAEWRCLNSNIVVQGLGIPDRKQPALTASEKEEADQDMISFLNITGSIYDWLQLGPFPTEPAAAAAATGRASGASTPLRPEEMSFGEERAGSNPIFVSDWLPPEPLKAQEFTGTPTYIDNDGIIYLHDVTQTDTLDLIRKALEVKFEHPDPKAKFVKWSVGQPCIARFYLDKRFYRGRVLEVNEATSSCLIHYVDYGNEESCSIEDMRKSIVLYQVPIQAHKCVLSRIFPKKGQWDKNTLDYIHKSIVDKKCFVSVLGSLSDDVTPVHLKIDKIYIQDLLVDLDMAVYADGTKAQKYVPLVRKPKMAEMEYVAESDSGPDYILEEDESIEPQSTDSFDMTSFANKDWCTLMDEEQEKPTRVKYVTFPSTSVDEEFLCNIIFVNDTMLELGLVHSNETDTLYNEMFEDIQAAGATLPVISGIYENKACIALFHEDKKWYRACILQYSKTENKIKVKYVDFGNIETLSAGEVREILDEWAVLPPASVSVQLYGIRLDPNVEVDTAREEYEKVFLTHDTLNAKVVKREGPSILVELRNDEGSLVYENLIGTIFQKIED